MPRHPRGGIAERIRVNQCWDDDGAAGARAGMTSDDHQSRSEHYREVADSLRRLARQTRFPQVQQELSDLADSFERMAEFTATWEPAER